MAVDRRLSEQLEPLRGSTVVILGVGNALKGDDAVGPLVCQLLTGRLSARVIDAGTAPENYIRPVVAAAPDAVLVVDAFDFGGRPGEIRLFEPERLTRFAFSTHALSLHLFIDMLGRESKPGIWLVGIQVCQVELGHGLSPEVQRAVQVLVDTFRDVLRPAKAAG